MRNLSAGKSANVNNKKKYLTKVIQESILDEYDSLEHSNLLFGEPERLFQVIEEWLGYFAESDKKPSVVIARLKNAQLDELQRYCLLKYLAMSLGQLPYYKKWVTALEKVKVELSEAEYKVEAKTELPKFGLQFQNVRRYSDSLPNDDARIRYLITVKTVYEQQDKGLIAYSEHPTFSDQCELEIKKIRDLMKLGETSIPNSKKQSSEKRALGGTQQQNLLAMYFMLECIQGKGTVVDKASFISFLTGFSSEKVRQLLPKVLERAESNWTEFEKDIDVIRGHFQKLGLSEIVKMIDNELTELARGL